MAFTAESRAKAIETRKINRERDAAINAEKKLKARKRTELYNRYNVNDYRVSAATFNPIEEIERTGIFAYDYTIIMYKEGNERQHMCLFFHTDSAYIDNFIKRNSKDWKLISKARRPIIATDAEDSEIKMKRAREYWEDIEAAKTRRIKEEAERNEQMKADGFDPNDIRQVDCWHTWKRARSPNLNSLAEYLLRENEILVSLVDIDMNEAITKLVNKLKTDSGFLFMNVMPGHMGITSNMQGRGYMRYMG